MTIHPYDEPALRGLAVRLWYGGEREEAMSISLEGLRKYPDNDALLAILCQHHTYLREQWLVDRWLTDGAVHKFASWHKEMAEWYQQRRDVASGKCSDEEKDAKMNVSVQEFTVDGEKKEILFSVELIGKGKEVAQTPLVVKEFTVNAGKPWVEQIARKVLSGEVSVEDLKAIGMVQ